MARAVRHWPALVGVAGMRPPRTKLNWPGCVTTPHRLLGKRPDLARWVARQVTGPGERAVAVTMTLRTETVQAPDEPAAEGGRATASKVLYQANLAAPA